MLAVKSHESRMTSAHVVESKGPVDSTTRRLVADLDWLGLRRLVFKSDQEPAILALKQAVRESMPTVEFVMEESPVEGHQSNGTIEVTVREIKKTSKSDEECVGRAHEMRSTFGTSYSGISRATRGEIDVEVSSWS